jgi:hypothetical protein
VADLCQGPRFSWAENGASEKWGDNASPPFCRVAWHHPVAAMGVLAGSWWWQGQSIKSIWNSLFGPFFGRPISCRVAAEVNGEKKETPGVSLLPTYPGRGYREAVRESLRSAFPSRGPWQVGVRVQLIRGLKLIGTKRGEGDHSSGSAWSGNCCVACMNPAPSGCGAALCPGSRLKTLPAAKRSSYLREIPRP